MNEHAPGWYEHDGERRYWDGDQWTHSTSLPATPTAPPTAPPAAPPPPGGVVAPYAPPPSAYAPQPPYMVPRKEPGIALLASFFIPGLGSMINGDVGPGVGILGLYLFGLVLIICLGWIIVGFIGLPIALAAWIWGMVHGYQGAVRHNQLAGYPG